MLQHVALHVSRRTTSQNPYHTHRPTNTHRKTCMQLHTPKDTGTLAQGTQGMGIHVGWLWGPDVFMSGRVRLGFTVSKSHRVHTHTHTQVRHMAQKTQAAHSTLVCWMKAVLPHCVCPVLLRWLQHCNQAAVSWFSAMYRWYLVLLFQRGSFQAISIPFLLSRLAFLTLNSSPVSDLFC